MIAGAGLLGVLGVLGRSGDDAAHLIGKGVNSADDFVPAAVTHADDFYTPGVVRHTDDAGHWGARDAADIAIDRLPDGVELILKQHRENNEDRPGPNQPLRIDPRVFTPPPCRTRPSLFLRSPSRTPRRHRRGLD